MHWPSVLLYLSASMGLMAVNPMLFQKYMWMTPLVLGALQNVGTVMLCVAKAGPKRLAKGIINPRLWVLAHVSLVNIVMGLRGSSAMSLAMFTALRRMAIAMTMYGNVLVGNEPWPSRRVQTCVWVMILAAGGAAWRDAAFDATLYGVVFANNVATATVQVGTKSILKDVSKWQMLFVTALTNWFWMLLYVEWDDVVAIEFSVPLLGSCMGGVAINVGAAWVIENNGPLFLAMLGSTKNIVMALLSVFNIVGAAYAYDPLNVFGLFVAAGASLTYVWAKEKERMLPI